MFLYIKTIPASVSLPFTRNAMAPSVEGGQVRLQIRFEVKIKPRSGISTTHSTQSIIEAHSTTIVKKRTQHMCAR